MSAIEFALLGAVGLLGATAYVLAPLFRDEDDLEPFDRARSGVQQQYGESEEPTPASTKCPNCEREVSTFYDFCGSCVSPVGN